MVKNHTKGSFNVGNTSYIPFNEKHSDTQFLTLIALYHSIQKPNCKINNGNTKLKSNNIKNNLTSASFAKLSNNIINLNKYISWLKSTASGYGFGEGFIAIQALHMLEGKLNPYWATIIT